MRKLQLIFLLSLMVGQVLAQHPEIAHPVLTNDEDHPCIDAATYAAMEAEMQANRHRLGLDGPRPEGTAITSLEWPLRPAAGLDDCDYWYISAFVDQDASSGIQDWNCGTRTYNGHRGVDIVPWPFIWDKMDRDLVEVIAAAPGTIIAKVDGNPDRVCDGVGGGSNSNNYITVQHADGSTALYVHLKSGAMTSKTVGQTVSTGEYLGVVGSAGQSTGVHLHFEIRSDGTFANYIDPFDGSCNTVSAASWWASQEPYADPKLLKLSLHTSWPYMASCPNTTDTLYEADTFLSVPGTQATFYACTKHVLTGDTWNFRVLNPDQTVFDSWNYTSNSNRNTSSLGWNRPLPTAPGVYTYEGTFNGVTCTQPFTILPVLAVAPQQAVAFTLYPNPNHGSFRLRLADPTRVTEGLSLRVFNTLGQMVHQVPVTGSETVVELTLPQGVYLYQVAGEGGTLHHGKLQIE